MSEINIQTKTLSKRVAKKLLMELFDTFEKYQKNPYEATVIIDEKGFCLGV